MARNDYQLDINPGSFTAASSIFDWDAVIFDEADWDTAAKVQFLNEQDARYNNLSVAELEAKIESA